MWHGEEGPSLSTLSSVNGYVRVLANVRARIRTIRFHESFLQDYSEKAYAHTKRAFICLHILKRTDWKDRPTYLRIEREWRSWGSTQEHMREIFGHYIKRKRWKTTPLEDRFLNRMRESCNSRRALELKTRVYLEILEKQSKGWLIVYDTLTLADEYLEQVMSAKSCAVQTYLQRWKRGTRINERKTSDHFSYFGAIERGENTGRLHFHFLLFVKRLPKGCIDPNARTGVPFRRVIEALRAYWPYGWNTPMALRFNGLDNWARLGWRWPVENVNGKWHAVQATVPQQAAGYMTEYVLKSYNVKDYRWRTRASQGFGKKPIHKMMELLSDASLAYLTSVPSSRIVTHNDLTLPLQIVKQAATRTLLLRHSISETETTTSSRSDSASRSTDADELERTFQSKTTETCSNESYPNGFEKKSRPSSTLKLLRGTKPRPSIVERWRSLIQGNAGSNLQSTGSTAILNGNASATSELRHAIDAVMSQYGHGDRKLAGRGVSHL